MDNVCFYDRSMFFTELSQSTERRKLSTNVLFENYLTDFKDIVQINGLVQEEMKIICHLLCTVELSLRTFKQILLILVPENPTIPSEVCEELIVLALSIYHENVNNTKKAQCILYWLLYVVEEQLTNVDIIDKYYTILFQLCNYGNLDLPVTGIIYFLTKPEDVQNWKITYCKKIIDTSKNELSMKKLLNFFETHNLIHETRQKGLFDSKTKFFIELANGLRSVRKELINKHSNSTSLQLTKYGTKTSDGFYSNIRFVNSNNKIELPRTQDLAKEFFNLSISQNSLSLLDNISGWCKLLMNTDAQLNLQLRFSNNLAKILDQIVNENNLIKKTKFLQDILELQKFSHQGLVAVNLFIFEYIISWDGMECACILYELFEYLSFTSEEELKNRFLEKLFPIFITGNELMCKIVIKSLTNLLCNLHLNSRRTKTDNHKILFGEQLREETEFEIVKCLTKCISQWCSICIYHYPQEEPLKHVVYTFFEKVSVLENLEPCIWDLFTIMTPNVFYNGMMSVNIYWLNRLAALMIRHIEVDATRIEEMTSQSSITKSFQMFQLYMADFYNALRVGKLFDKRGEGFIFKNLNRDEILKDLNFVNLNICFEMDKHIALAPYYMISENTVEDALDLLEKEAPNVHKLILLLDSNLENSDLNESPIY